MSSALILIRPDSFSLYYNDRPGSIGSAVTPLAVKDMEVVSDVELSKILTKFISGNPRAQISTVLAVADELCFALPQKGQKLDEAEKRLVELVPFTQVALTTVKAGSDTYMVGTNQDLYESYARTLDALHHPVVLVVPWMALLQAGVTRGEVDSVTVKRAFDVLTTLRGSAYPLQIEQNEVPVAIGEKTAQKSKKRPLGLIIFGVVACIYSLAMYWFFIRA